MWHPISCHITWPEAQQNKDLLISSLSLLQVSSQCKCAQKILQRLFICFSSFFFKCGFFKTATLEVRAQRSVQRLKKLYWLCQIRLHTYIGELLQDSYNLKIIVVSNSITTIECNHLYTCDTSSKETSEFIKCLC